MGGGINQGNNSASGTLTVTARVSNGASRYAMPTIPELVYAALLYKDGDPPENPPSEKFVEAEPKGDKFVFSFQRPENTSGTFTLEVFAFAKAEGEGTTTFFRETALFSKAKEGLTITGDEIIVGETIALEVNKSSTEKGEVSLQIKVPDGCFLEIDDTAKTNFTCEKESEDSTTYIVSASGIAAGAYPVTFTVKKDDEIVNIFTEYINVFNGLCTDTWGGLAKDMPKEITQDVVSTTFFVRGSDEEGLCWYAKNGYANIEGKDSNSGSFLDPFATIQKAVDTVIARNNGASDDKTFTIYIDGKLTQSTAVENMANISPDKDLKLKIESLSADTKAILDANKNSRVINAAPTSGKLELTLEKLVITNGKSGVNGGGVFFNGKTLEMTGCEVVGCEANNAGGVYVGLSGTFTMNNGEISNCSATNNGGGVYIILNGTFEMSGTAKITGCKTKSTSNGNGGGVFVAATGAAVGTFTMSGSASVPAGDDGKNDVYLSASGENFATITVAGALEATAPVATITLPASSYVAGTQVLRADANTGVTIDEDICSKIALTDEGCKIVPSADGKTGVLKVHTIFLNSESGSDSKLGMNASTQAVKTLSKAIEQYDKYNAEKIMVCAPYTLPSGESTLLDRTGKRKLTLVRYDGSSDVSDVFTGTLLTISQGDVTISNVTLDGNKENVTASGHLLCINGATVTLGDGATVCNNKKSSRGSGVYISSGTFKMTGGTVTGNEGTSGYGPGVYIDDNGRFEMSGGIISENDAYTSSYGGGGVYVRGSFEMSGGEISGNKAERGGGVYVPSACKDFTMTGGKIINNTATSHGGGVYVNGTFEMSGGEIIGNTASSGGGVYQTAVDKFTNTGGGTVSGNTPNDVYPES